MADVAEPADGSPGRDRAVAWLDERLAAAGRVRTGEVTTRRERPWGTVLSAPTGQGTVWLKMPGPGLRYEPALHRLLARVVPDRVPELLAADPGAGLLLLADAGATLNKVEDGAELIEALAEALPHYARLQRALTPYAAELVAAGVPDMRPHVLPERFEEALRVAAAYSAAQPDPAGARRDEETLRAIARLRDAVREWSERLRRGVVPPTVDHNDLHANNVLVGAGGHVRFADWGDAVVGHPFTGMKVTLGVLARRRGLADGDPVIVRLRDAYLAGFADLAAKETLVGELELACRMDGITGTLTWNRALADLGPRRAGEYVGDPLRRLRALTTRSWLGLDL